MPGNRLNRQKKKSVWVRPQSGLVPLSGGDRHNKIFEDRGIRFIAHLEEALSKEQVHSRRAQLAGFFRSETDSLRAKIPRVLLAEDKQLTANGKLKVLLSASGTALRFHDYLDALKRLQKNRFEGLACEPVDVPIRDFFNSFESEEPPAMHTKSVLNWFHGITGGLPEPLIRGGHSIMLIFDKKSIGKVIHGMHHELGKDPKLLGITVLGPDPAKLLETSQLVARFRLNDPVPIFDHYGKIFYPTAH